MQRWRRILLTGFSAISLLGTVVVTVLVLLPRSSDDGDLRIAGMKPEELRGVVVKLEDPTYDFRALQQVEDRAAVLTVESLVEPGGTPVQPAVLAARSNDDDTGFFSKDVLYLLLALTLAVSGSFAMRQIWVTRGRSQKERK